LPDPANPTQPASTPSSLFPADIQTNQTPPPAGDLATVTRIIDGDTIEVAQDGRTYRVRYIGMDTPEQGDFFYSEATEANQGLVKGQQVILVKDVSETDRYGRLLRYVYLADGTFVNAELVRQGYAVIATFPPDVRHQELFLQLEREAREAGRGLWAQPSGNGPLPTNAPAATNPLSPTNAPQQTNCDPAYPTVCIPPPPPDLDCGEIPYRDFTVLPSDPHRFDGDNDGVGCET
jgi:micrococcal nuclease